MRETDAWMADLVARNVRPGFFDKENHDLVKGVLTFVRYEQSVVVKFREGVVYITTPAMKVKVDGCDDYRRMARIVESFLLIHYPDGSIV